MNYISGIFFLLFSMPVVAQQASNLGKASPALSFDLILNFDRSQATLDDFKDKVVILDFWSTSCAPCIRSFPHLEELQSKFKQDIQIITISSDSEDRIKRFLERRAMSLPIVIDERDTLAALFPHRTIPHTIVLDKAHTIKAITTSSEITESLINEVLASREIRLEEKKEVLTFDPSVPLSGDGLFSYQITITPFKEGYPGFANPSGGDAEYKGRRILATNLSAGPLYEIAYQFSSGTRTVLEVADLTKFEWSKQSAICFDLIVPEALGEDRFNIMKQQLDTYFGYQSGIEEKVRPVLVLQKIKGIDVKLAESEHGEASYSTYSGNGLSMKGESINALSEFLESRLNIPVINETNLNGWYDLEVPWYNESPAQIHDTLKKIGLELKEAERKITVLVIKDK